VKVKAFMLSVNLFLSPCNNKNDTRLATTLRGHCYINDRRPRRATFPDASKKMIDRQNIKNRLQAMKTLNFDWIQESSKDIIRKKQN